MVFTQSLKFIIPFYAALGNSTLGFYVYFNNPRSKINISYAINAFIVVFWTIAIFLYSEARSPQQAFFWSKSAGALSTFIPVLFLFFFHVFPREDKTLPVIYPIIWFSVAFVFAALYSSNMIVKDIVKVGTRYDFVPGPLFLPFILYFCAVMLYAFNILTVKYFNSKGVNKLQIRYVFLGFFLGSFFPATTNLILPLCGNSSLAGIGPFFTIITVAFISYAITKTHLMDISVVISRTVAELLTVTFLGSIYIGLVWFYRAYVSTNIDIPFLAWTILYGILVGQTHNRIRLFIQTTADKVFLKGKYDYYKELSEISSQITQSLSVENILQTLHKAFYEVLEVSNPRIYLQDELSKPEVREYLTLKEPTFIEDELILPCLIEGKPIAIIKLGKKLSEDPYTDEDITLLKALANQTAVALDHHRMYEEMLKAQKQLLQADKLAALGRVAAGLAHEIKNPLAAIKGMAQTMEQNINDPEYITDFKEVVPKEIDRLNNLVENLLKLGKAPKLTITQINVNQLIENTLKLFENRCRAHKIKIIKELNPVPEIKADPDQLTQVFTNLLLNAIQAMPNGGKLTIESRFTNHNSLIIEIQDTGQGIPEDKLKDIFEPFFSTKAEGLGLGLAITYRIIKDHHGEIEVESKVGEGARFRVLFTCK